MFATRFPIDVQTLSATGYCRIEQSNRIDATGRRRARWAFMSRSVHSAPHRAHVDLRIGDGGLTVAAEITSGGLLAIGALVSGILLSTAVLVAAARRRAQN